MFWHIIYKNGFSLGNNLLLSSFLWGISKLSTIISKEGSLNWDINPVLLSMPLLNFLPWNGCKSFGFYWQLHFYVWFICATAHNVIYVKLFHFKHLAQEISRKADIILIWWKTPRISYRTFQIKTRASFKYRGFSGVKVNKSSPPIPI